MGQVEFGGAINLLLYDKKSEGIRVAISSRILAAICVMATAMPAMAEPGWSVPAVPGATDAPFLVPPKTPYVDPALLPPPGSEPAVARVPANMKEVARIGERWGTVTSVLRTPEHNRRVGGVANSYHLSGRAIDIARRPGVRHADIAAALRKSGFQLVESLDEGDHSHFAFARVGEVARAAAVVRPLAQLTQVEEGGRLRLRLSTRSPRTTER